MEANHLSRDNFSMLDHNCAQICKNMSQESQQLHFRHQQKNSYWPQLQTINNEVKTLRLNHCKVNNQQERKQETHEDLDELTINTKKQTIVLSNDLEFITENHLQPTIKNCKIPLLHQHTQTKKMQLLDQNQPIESILINYNNSNVGDKINLYQTQNLDMMENQLLFIPHKGQIDNKLLMQYVKNQQLESFLQGEKVLFPIPDYLLTKLYNLEVGARRTLTENKLPMGFCQMLELLNLAYLFPESFKFESETITMINHILQTTLLSKDHPHDLRALTNQLNELLCPVFTKQMKHLIYLLIQDLNSQRLQSLSNSYAYNVLSLAKFCQQNQLLQFVFEYNWPIIMLQLIKLHHQLTIQQVLSYLLFMQDNYSNSKCYNKSVHFLQNHIRNQFHQIPQTFQDRFFIISLLIDCYSRTGSFREVFNKKTQTSRNGNKRKMLLQEEKRDIELKIKKLLTNSVKKHKRITKPAQKKCKKQHNLQDNSQNESRANYENTQQLENIQKLRSQLQQINQEIEKQNREDSLSACHYLGKDRFGQLYWYVTFFNDKLFVQRQRVWGCLGLQEIQLLLQGLDRRGIEENKLFERLMEYYSHQLKKHSKARMQPQPEQNTILLYKSTNLFHSSSTLVQKIYPREQKQQQYQNEDVYENENENDSSKNSTQNNQLLIHLGGFKICKDSLIKMIEVGDKKMTEYLKQRNSRWGSDESRHLLVNSSLIILKFSTLSAPFNSTWLIQAKKQLTLFNQKICVVEIQYKVFVEQSVQQVDLKVKKIQTKIWGINQKYKHNWYDFINSCTSFTELFFAVSVLYSLIKKYTSKQRKLRKQYEEVKLKSVWKVTPAVKQWRQQWNEQCQVCGSNGEVLCCDYCPKVYHLPCVNLTSIPETEYKCKSCKQQITTRNQFKSFANTKKKHKK